MFSSTAESRRIRFLVINLVLVAGLICGLVGLILASPYILAFEPTRTPTASSTPRPTLPPTATSTASLTPTITNTSYPSLTPTPTLSPTPTDTPSPTPTETSLPTLTPARPRVEAGSYTLRTWTPEDADYLVRLLQGYPNTLLQLTTTGEPGLAYYQSYQYAVLARQEALLRFPEATQAEGWRWGLAYNHVLLGEASAGQEYADLIAAGLNRGATDLSSLYQWFQAQEPRLALYMVALVPPPDLVGSYLVEVRHTSAGSAFIWLRRTPGAYQASPLLTRFDFTRPSQASWILAELDGDLANGQEAAIYFSTRPAEFTLQAPAVFNLGQVPARRLPFLPETALADFGMQYTAYWAVQPVPAESLPAASDLVFRSAFFPACPVQLERRYRWNGQYFAFVEQSLALQQEGPPTGFCDLAAEHAARFWGAPAASQLMQALLPGWPPARDIQGAAYPQDALDEWRYRLGLQLALSGEFEAAREILQAVLLHPAAPRSRWLAPVQSFLELYRRPEDVYRACLLATACEPAEALRFLASRLPAGQDGFTLLRQQGVSALASGYFDFQGDQRQERWFTVRPRLLDPIEFWILGDYPGGFVALRVATVAANPPQLEVLDPAYVDPAGLDLLPVTFLESQVAFHLSRLPDTGEPYIQSVPLRREYPNRFLEPLEQARQRLLAGSPAQAMYIFLRNLQDFPGLLCQASWSCDAYYYLLGLSAELAGRPDDAVQAYHRLWSDYSRSPYTWMARQKLQGEVYLSPTPTSTATPTIPLTPTPTVTGTPPTSTPTPMVTSTVEEYPYP